jgi:hypothetical protein
VLREVEIALVENRAACHAYERDGGNRQRESLIETQQNQHRAEAVLNAESQSRQQQPSSMDQNSQAAQIVEEVRRA